MEPIHLPRNGKPLYVQIRDHYKELILSQKLKYGDRIDSEMAIQKMFDVSRITARQAISDLEKEGLVSRGRGKGTFVCYKPENKDPEGIVGFTRHIKKRGKEPGTCRFDIQRVAPDPEILDVFHMISMQPVYCFRRIRTVDDVRICYMLNYFPGDLALPMDVDQYDESVLETLHSITGLTPCQSLEEFCAMIPSAEICRALSISREIPVLCKRRTSLDERGRVIEYSVTYYRGDLYTHRIERKTGPED